MTDDNPQSEAVEGPQLAILRVYLKDASFEAPNSPQIFMQDFKPEVNIQLNTGVNELEDGLYEVILSVTATSKQGDKTGFLVEVQQAGIFTLRGMDESQKTSMLGAYCPNTLFPFAREAISDLVVKGGFPQLLLAPVNFEAMHAQHLERVKSQAESSETASQ